jgi:hypothetical protein
MDAAEIVRDVFACTAAARRIALEDAAKACEAEAIESPDNADDETYNRAIQHCVDAIRTLI